MTDFDTYKLCNVDPDDISDVLVKVQKSFNLKFGDTELKDVKTFGELCDIITNKVQGGAANDCTTQQGFYKLRQAIADTLLIDKNIITPNTGVQQLFPRHSRRQNISEMENLLGFKTKILRPKHWITATLVLTLLISFVGLFVFWQAGLIGLLISVGGLKLSDKLGNELDLQTVGQIAEKISREHYLKSRRNAATINRNEIEKKVRELFRQDLNLENTTLTRQATFG